VRQTDSHRPHWTARAPPKQCTVLSGWLIRCPNVDHKTWNQV
jgi:hypothetical protein